MENCEEHDSNNTLKARFVLSIDAPYLEGQFKMKLGMLRAHIKYPIFSDYLLSFELKYNALYIQCSLIVFQIEMQCATI